MARTGLIHVHSKYSYDGKHSLEELVDLARKRGFDFVAMTEHADMFDVDQMREFVGECRALSSQHFLVIPGVEFVCAGDLHILGLGIERLTDSKDPALVARFIHEQGGLAIVAHPSRNGYKIPVAVSTVVDGIEIWNARYDGWLVPNDFSIRLWKSLKESGVVVAALGGQDLHEMKSSRYVKVIVAPDELTQSVILRALQSESFRISNSYLTLNPTMLGGWLRLLSMACVRRLYLLARFVARPIKKGFLALGKGRPWIRSAKSWAETNQIKEGEKKPRRR